MSKEKIRKPISKGKCHFCGNTYAKSGISRHLKTCKARQAAEQDTSTSPLLHIQVEGTYLKDYWLHIEISATRTLADLDQFLRNIWLECCGHLSAFKIGKQEYTCPHYELYGIEDPAHDMMMQFKQILGVDAAHTLPEDLFPPPPKPMSDTILGFVLKPGLKFTHEYDFGTTTDLTLKVIGEREGYIDKQSIVHILARNEPPAIKCDYCDTLATKVCTECIWYGEGWVCDKHAAEHSEEMLLPVVNSPRVGMCGYTGESF